MLAAIFNAMGTSVANGPIAKTHNLIILLTWLIASPAMGQAESDADPRMFGFKIPKGKVTWLKGNSNAVINWSGGKLIVKPHVKVGDNVIMIMPDGKLEPVNKSQITDWTNDKVKWKTPEDMVDIVLKDPRLRGMRTRVRRKHLFVYNCSEKMADVTMRVMESMTTGVVNYMKTLGLKAKPPEAPLVVIMFRTEAQYQAYDRKPPGAIAYYNIINNNVVLYEESGLIAIDRDLAIGEALSTIAHEGAHQILANTGIQSRLSGWPMWISEGMAEYLAPTEVTRNLRWKGAGKLNEMRMLELETHLRMRAIEGIDGSVLQDAVATARLDSTGYATAWSLTNFLSKYRKKGFREYLLACSKLRPFEGSFLKPAAEIKTLEDLRKQKIKKNTTEFEQFFGSEWKDLETEMIKFLVRQKFESPFSAFVHYAVLAEVVDDDLKTKKLTGVFYTPRLAQEYATVISKRFATGGAPTIKIVKCPDRATAVRQTNQF